MPTSIRSARLWPICGFISDWNGMFYDTRRGVVEPPPLDLTTGEILGLFEAAPTLLAISRGPDHTIVRVNAAFQRLVGDRPVLGVPLRDALPEMVDQGFVETLDRVYRTGETFVASEVAVEFARGPGGHRERSYLSFVYRALTDAGGVTTGIVAHAVDVTEQVRARQELAEREAFYRSLLENSLDKTSVLTPEGIILYESPASLELLGWSAAEMVGRNVLHMVHPADREAAVQALSGTLREPGSTQRLDARLRHRDGSWVSFEVIGEARPSSSGSEIVINCRDVTERRAAENRLRQRERQFRTLIELTPQLVWSARADGHRDYFNPQFYAYTGMEDSTGWKWTDVLHPDDVERTLLRWNTSLRTGEPYEMENRLRRASDGAYRWHIGRAVALRDAHGRIIRWFGTCTDVHEERRALEAARVMHERFDAATRATADVIWDLDLAKGTVWHNENVRHVLRLDDAATMDTPEAWADRLHPDDRERVAVSFQSAIAGTGMRWNVEYRFIRGDGSIAHVVDRGVIVRDESGTAIRVIGSLSDITQRVELEAELRQAQKLDAVGRLAGGIAHDFNNLLTVITSYTEIMLADFPKNDPARGDIDEIRKAANKAAALTRQLLAFSRRQVLQPRAVMLNEIVADMERMLRRIIGETITLAAHTDDALRPVWADPGQIEQIVMNLVINARHAMPSGGTVSVRTSNVTLDVYAAERAGVRAGDYVQLLVEDDGTGMDAATLTRVFEPFFTTRAPGEGTGLGLSTVHGIVHQSNGCIDIDSAPGAGTRVRILLPASDAATPALPKPTVIAAAGGTGTILLVEDEDAVRAITRRTLVRSGYAVIEARNGIEAVRIFENSPGTIDLVLTDLVMPGLGGRELAMQVRARAPATPVLFMSGYSEGDVLAMDGMDPDAALLEKPFTVDQLTGAVRAVLGRAA